MFYATWHDFALILLTLVVSLGMAWTVWRRLEETPKAGEVLALYASAACGILAVPSFALLQYMGVGFHSLRWFYHTGAVVPAIVSVVLSAGLWRRGLEPWARRLAIALGVFFFSFTPLAVHMTFIAPYQLEIERVRVSVPDERAGEETIRVVVLADIQTRGITSWEERVLDEVHALEPDIILIPGDVLQLPRDVYAQNMGPMKDWLGRLRAPAGVWMVSGDVDVDARLLASGTGVEFIDDQVRSVRVRDREVTLGGVTIDYHSAEANDVVRRLETAEGGRDIRLLLAHRPGAVETLSLSRLGKAETRIDLVVSGHTHGGQIVVPGFGPPVTMSTLERHVASGGLHEVGGRRVYVSRGVGMERMGAPQVRFNCPPEVTLLEIGGR